MSQFSECRRATGASEELKAECLEMVNKLFINWRDQHIEASSPVIHPSGIRVYCNSDQTEVQITLPQVQLEYMLDLRIDIPRHPMLRYGQGRNDVLRDPVTFAILTISNWVEELNEALRTACIETLQASLERGILSQLGGKVTAKEIFTHHIVDFFSKLKIRFIGDHNGISLELPVDGVLDVNRTFALQDISRKLA